MYTYAYVEMKVIILESDFTIVDERGKSVRATKGDRFLVLFFFFFQKGVTITFTSEKGAGGFSCWGRGGGRLLSG